ncbi:L-sorbosone dehydrogenase [Adhaeribacter aerolatus]|uniref:L-sorbosone dehydrogenase n=1 Tax=Adhaeribacter aerolatus TaxID=670289 RepID=A0A512AVN3_9BACT|nr:PQQ-dependent sugar dehydrogenase [Adhaeribacter aerolatus]GEO03730.1 L-sorbosone dehydrogenase [Adhaeribacter aerolatus]
MNKPLSSLLLIFCFLAAACYKNSTATRNRPGKTKYTTINTPVERQFTLDSTTVGVSTIISNLNVAWEIAWGPDNWIWYTEQSGTVSKVNPATGEKKLMLTIPNVYRHRTLGLLSMVLHPQMKKNPYVFLNYTYQKETRLFSKWVRYSYDGEILNNPVVLLELPADVGHNGSRIVIDPDGKLMLATGDADVNNNEKNGGNAQNDAVLSGKILRLNIDGTIPKDNPVPGSAVWAKGFRVPQGLVFAANGNLYSAEHGHLTDDEINLIRKGGNYGYPKVAGKCNLPHEKEFCATHPVIEPLMAWTPTVATAGIDYYNATAIPEWQNSILVTTLKETDFRVLKLNKAGDTVVAEHIYLDQEFGRLRDVCVSPDGDIYISTSNRDWNPASGFPQANDDRIIRLFKIKPGSTFAENVKQINAPQVTNTKASAVSAGNLVYNQYCASCHKTDGNGVAETFPPLNGAEQVTGDKSKLINIVLHGLSGPVQVKNKTYDQQMPAFSFLSDQELADVLTYVRTAFGGNSGAISTDDIAKARLKGSK